MPAVSDSRARSGAPRPHQADRAAEVSWFDIRDVTLSPADLADLDVRETARAAAFVFPADRHRYQVAHVMLRRVLAGHLGREPGRLVFAREPCPTCGGPSGKPVLAGQDSPVPAFSLAHSGDAVAVAVAVAGQPVGVDVEREATGCVCSLVTAMHPGDATVVEPLPEPERHTAIIRWWVRAEAVLKCAGTGIGHGLDAFPVLGGPARNKVSPGARPLHVPGWADAAGCSFAPLSAPKGYQAAIAQPGLRVIRYRWGSGRLWAAQSPAVPGRPAKRYREPGAGPDRGSGCAHRLACPRIRENLRRLWLRLARAQIGHAKADFGLQRGAPRAAGSPGRTQSGCAGL